MIGFPTSVGVNITSTMAGIIICCSAVGSMVLPYLVNYLFPILGPDSLIYLVLSALCLSALDFIIMLIAFRRKSSPNDPPRMWYHFFLKNKPEVEKKNIENISMNQSTQPDIQSKV